MIKNNKYFVAPHDGGENFKVLFARLAAAGAGRPINESGGPDGPWTPEELTNTISAFERNAQGIDLRAVQVWFQSNDSGISDTNIRWLARIFGCEDPDATSQWQAELRAAKERLRAERKQRRLSAKALQLAAEQNSEMTERGHQLIALEKNGVGQGLGRMTLALRTEATFTGSNILKMPIIIWCGLAILWLISLGLGNHSIAYSVADGVEKQVGFIWAIGWNIGDPIFMPIFLVLASRLVSDWRTMDRPLLAGTDEEASMRGWTGKLNDFTVSFWVILLSCALGVFLVQWIGVYLIPLYQRSMDVSMIDWWLIALVNPNALSTQNAIWSSFLGFAYSGLIYWFLFSGMLMLYIVASDYLDLCRMKKDAGSAHAEEGLGRGFKILDCTYRCTVVGIIIALTIKLNGAYLVTDAPTIVSWLLGDSALALGLTPLHWSWIDDSPPPFFTSFLLLFLHLVVFVACAFIVGSGIANFEANGEKIFLLRIKIVKMGCALALLSIGYLSVGLFYGFSILLAVSAASALASLFYRFSPRNPDKS